MMVTMATWGGLTDEQRQGIRLAPPVSDTRSRTDRSRLDRIDRPASAGRAGRPGYPGWSAAGAHPTADADAPAARLIGDSVDGRATAGPRPGQPLLDLH